MEMKFVEFILHKIKKIIPVIIIIASLITVPVRAESYVYNYEGEALKTPDAVTVKCYADVSNAGFSKLNQPQDMDADANGNLYIADTDNNRIVVLDKYYKYLKEYSSVNMPDGTTNQLKEPKGIYCCENGKIYIADSGNIMPPKATWFEPKLRSGLVVHKLS